MLGLGSFKSSKWAFDYLSTSNSFNSNVTITDQTSSFGLWNTPTVGPDGFVYMLPCSDYATVNNVADTPLTGVLVVDPGNSNNGTNSYSVSSSQYISPGTNRDSIPVVTTAFGSRIRFASKGILAPNGKIYFIGFDTQGVVILNPSGFGSTWQYKTFSQMGFNSDSTAKFTGGVLGSDGKIYLIPNNNATARIDPDSNTMQVGYWTGAVGKRFKNSTTLGNYFAPVNSNGNAITSTVTNGSLKGKFQGFKDAIAHPNGKIYVFPYQADGNSRWIFIIDPNNFGTVKEFYSDSSLALPIPNPVTSTSGSVFGTCENIFLEKLKDGQNSDDLKIYATYSGNSAYTSNWNSAYPNAKMLELDTVDNTVGLVGDTNTANGGTGAFGQAARPGIQFPNGFIVSFLSGLAGTKISNVIITGDEGGSSTNKFPDSAKNIIGSGNDVYFPDFGDPPNANGSFGGSSILINNSFGKIIFYGKQGGMAFSVKGFYPGIKYFDSGDNIYKIPTNLEGLETSLWNSYCNKPF